ncbi:MAG: helix-turn-helix domain-containing protein [Devosia sp.]|nr:helix-turn-helix domain-containing protein [Devosia sp.]
MGLTIETVSRTMSKLTASGIIAAAGRHAVTLRRPNKLAALAGDGG